MALVGGGGAGNVAGSNPSGTGSSLNYIGNHAYATSGAIEDAASGAPSTTMLDFTTGPQYIDANVDFTSESPGSDAIHFNIIFDNQVIAGSVTDSSSSSVLDSPFKLLIPPYTRVQIKWGIATVTKNAYVVITGRVYA